ncbi:MAG TPA: hydantoinase B/oxoprolinase family protein [Gaiellaceae bacterium]|nr:hydantoinase B/oxoprolinase family protein [Gaiellaceae bacterium]
MKAMRTDPVTLEILKNYFVAIAEGMAYTLERTAHTTFVKESADFTTAVATPGGEFFCFPRSIGVSSFLGLNMKAAIDAISDYEPGDIVITNDPFSTQGLATHLPDFHMFKPVFEGDEILCFAWCFIHCSDVGGLVPASISPRATDLQQEGLRVPPRKLYRAGEPNHDLVEIILANCRIPEQNWGDMKAMVAALNTAEKRLHEVAGKFGAQVVGDAAEDLLDWAEERARKVFAAIPDGEYSFSDYLDDAMDEIPIRLALTLKVAGDEITIDYSDTDPQVNAAFNLPAFGPRHPFLAQGLINYVFSQDPGVQLNGAVMRPITIVAPKGSLVNPTFPASVGVRAATTIRLYGVVLGALSQAVPGTTPAVGCGQACIVVMSVPDMKTGQRKVTVLEPFNGGGGATSRADGVAAMDSANGSLKNTPVESIEMHIPVLVERYELLPDSAGAGRNRGGWGLRFDFRVLAPNSVLTARGMERVRFEPWGVAGGTAAGRTVAILNPGTAEERNLGKIDVLHLSPGDVVSMRATGGGGYGDPLERDPVRVAVDVEEGLLSPSNAADLYGVVLEDGRLDEGATTELREQRAAARGAAPGESQIDVGPSRGRYEETWTPEASTALAHFLRTLPLGLQSYVKATVHEAVEAGAGPLTEETVHSLCARVLADDKLLDLFEDEAREPAPSGAAAG